MILKPQRLVSGEKIGIISPAGPVNEKLLKKALSYLRSLGHTVVLGEFALKKNGYLAGTDEQRISDIHYMFENPDISAIIMARGGYGGLRLLENLDYDLIEKNPKIFLGFSDTTALQWAIFRKTGLVTFSGPMAETNFGRNQLNKNAESHLWSVIKGENKGKYLPDFYSESTECLYSGKVEGHLVSGCLAVVLGLLGTPYCPNLEGAILVLEDVNEEPYQIDRALYTLKAHNVFEKIAGLVLGKFVSYNGSQTNYKDIPIEEIVVPIAQRYKLPVMTNMSYGHVPQMLTLPIGVQSSLDTGTGSLVLMENGVN